MCSPTLYEFASLSKRGKFYASTIKANPSRGGDAKPRASLTRRGRRAVERSEYRASHRIASQPQPNLTQKTASGRR
jgi:hypothetical protein